MDCETRGICRLCLRYYQTPNYTLKLSENGLTLPKIRFCLYLAVPLDENLPGEACIECLKMVHQMYQFRERVTENQKKLHDLLEEGHEELMKFYSSYDNLRNLVIKTEEDTNASVDNNIGMPEKEVPIKYIYEEIEGNYDYEPFEEYSSEEEGKSTKRDSKVNETDNCPPKKQKTKKIKTKAKTKARKVNAENFITDKSKLENKCLTCSKVLPSQTELLSHYRSEHGLKTGDEKKNLKDVEYIKVEGGYSCKECGKEYEIEKKMKRHLLVHTEDRPYVCNFCARTFKSAPDIVLHSRAHNGFKRMCKFNCGFGSPYLGALRDHERRHMNSFKYTCETCGKGFMWELIWKQHQNVHKGLKPYKCDICGARFHMTRYLATHRNKKHPEALKEKRFLCVHCDQPCPSMRALQEHQKEHGIEKQKPELHLCDLCGKTLSSAYKLRQHRWTHNQGGHHVCGSCNKTFAKKSSLEKHLVTHTKERNFACDQCDRRYSQKSILTRHIKQDHSEPNECSKCHESFSSRTKQRIHARKCIS